MNIRKPAVAGSFYPGDRQELVSQLNGYFNQTKKVIDRQIKALIVPHAGYVYSGLTAAWGYRQIINYPSNPRRGEKLSMFSSLPAGRQVIPIIIEKYKSTSGSNNKHFVLIGPSHNFYFENLISNDFDLWQTPFGNIKHQLPVNRIEEIKINNDYHIPEHSLEVQLPFLLTLNKNISISCFLTGSKVEEKTLAEYFIKNYSSSLFIFSSDLSHYLPENIARKKDKLTIGETKNFNTDYFKNEDNTACGGMGITILLEMAKMKKWQAKLIYYDTSATFSGDGSQVVGYSAIGFFQN